MTAPTPAAQLNGLERDYRRITRRLKNSSPKPENDLRSAVVLTGALARLYEVAGRPEKASGYRRETRNLMARLRETNAEGMVLWAEAVLSQQDGDWDAAERRLLAAEPLMGQCADYWFDRGRLQFGWGRLSLAQHAFLQVYTLEEEAGRIAGRTFRWLATTYRWLGQPEKEATILHEAMEAPWQHAPERDGQSLGFGMIKALIIDDSGMDGTLETVTHAMAMERLPRLLIDAGKYAEAIDLIDEWYGNTHRFQAEFSAMKVEALYAKGEGVTASRYAKDMADRFKGGHMRTYCDPRLGTFTMDWEKMGGQPPKGSVPVGGGDLIVAAGLIHSNQPFSGNNRLLQAFKDVVSVTEGFALTTRGRKTAAKTSMSFVQAYQAARRAIETGRVDLAIEVLWEAAGVALEERSPLPLAYCIHELSQVAGDHPKLAQLCQEAQQRFPESSEIMLEVGDYHRTAGQPLQALAALERAAHGPREERYAEPLLAEVIGALGDHDEALARFKVLLNRDWSSEPQDVISEAVFVPALRWAEASGQPLWTLNWVDVWQAQYGPQGNPGSAAALFETAGRAALSLRDYGRAYGYHRRAAAAYAAHFQTSGQRINLHKVARNNAMTAFCALLAGYPQQVAAWLETARTQATGLDVIDLVSALASAHSGDLVGARTVLLDVERSPLWAQVARLVAQDCRAAGQEGWAEELERKADVQEGRTLSLEEALDQLGEQERRLLAARQEVEANLRYREQTREVFETLVVRSGLLPEDHASYLALKRAIESGQVFDPELVLHSVLEHLAERMQGQRNRGDVCQLLVGPTWNVLDSGLREQLELAQDYVAYARQQELKDYGPALMYLARPVEELLRTQVARRLVQRAASQRADVPWDYAFTLGCAPQRLFGLLPQREVAPGYSRIVDEVLEAAGPSVRRYIRMDWRDDAQALVDARNAWAHRRDALGREAFERLLPRVVGAPGSETVLGAALAVQRSLAL